MTYRGMLCNFVLSQPWTISYKTPTFCFSFSKGQRAIPWRANYYFILAQSLSIGCLYGRFFVYCLEVFSPTREFFLPIWRHPLRERTMIDWLDRVLCHNDSISAMLWWGREQTERTTFTIKSESQTISFG